MHGYMGDSQMKRNAEDNGLLVLLLLSVASCNCSIARATYTNPVGEIARIGDPFALRYEDKYYLYGTSPPRYGFKVWESRNLEVGKTKGLRLILGQMRIVGVSTGFGLRK